MKRFFRFPRIALLLGLSLALVMSGVVLAITITVDGDRDSTWDGSGSQTPGSVSDINEPGVNDNVDIETFQWTNDQTDFYFLVDVHTLPLMPALAPVNICLDTDGSATTDIPAGNTIYRDRCSYNNTPAVSGIDVIVEAYRLSNGALLVDVFDATQWNGSSMGYLGSGVLGYNPSATTPVVEISVPLSLLGYGPGTCPSSIPVVVYYDGGDSNLDDNLPDSGTILINCGSPNAVTLSAIDAGPALAGWPAFALVVAMVAGGAGLFVWKRRA